MRGIYGTAGTGYAKHENYLVPHPGKVCIMLNWSSITYPALLPIKEEGKSLSSPHSNQIRHYRHKIIINSRQLGGFPRLSS